MKNIRRGVFETNSSSTHSIHIDQSTELLDTIVPNEDGILVLSGGEFGWGYEKTNDARTKANYCAVDCFNNEANKQLLKNVLKEQTGATHIVFHFTTNFTERDDVPWAYIDHQSNGTSGEAFESKETLRQFIFNKKSWLFLGNDNEHPPAGFYNVPTASAWNLCIDNKQYPLFDKEDENEIYKTIQNHFSRYLNDWQFDRRWHWDLDIDLGQQKCIKYKRYPTWDNKELTENKIVNKETYNFTIEKI